MSREAVKQIISRAMAEPAFREQLRSDPDAALSGYELTAEEMQMLKGLPRESFENGAMDLEERVSRGRIKVKLPWD